MKLGIIAACALALGLAGCTPANLYSPAPGQKMHITAETMAGFKEYQALIGSTHPGAFAVSQSGDYYSYNWCGDLQCTDDNTAARQVIERCGKSGQKCYLFASRNNIRVDYDVVP